MMTIFQNSLKITLHFNMLLNYELFGKIATGQEFALPYILQQLVVHTDQGR